MKGETMRQLLWTAGLLVCAISQSPATRAQESQKSKPGDWPMWGGTPDRNMVSSMTGLPETWDIETKKNVKWVAGLGSQTYGNPVVAGGKVFVGTNNEALYDKEIPGDKGILAAFNEADGKFLWQMVSDKHPAGRVHDWPFQGVCSSPIVDGEILYYVTNHGEVLALDTEGFMMARTTDPTRTRSTRPRTTATSFGNST